MKDSQPLASLQEWWLTGKNWGGKKTTLILFWLGFELDYCAACLGCYVMTPVQQCSLCDGWSPEHAWSFHVPFHSPGFHFGFYTQMGRWKVLSGMPDEKILIDSFLIRPNWKMDSFKVGGSIWSQTMTGLLKCNLQSELGPWKEKRGWPQQKSSEQHQNAGSKG